MKLPNLDWLRRSGWIVECVLGYAVLVAFNALVLPDSPAFDGIQPHPYLFLIVLLASRYGLEAGLLSGIVGTLLYWLWANPFYRIEIWGTLDLVLSTGLIFVATGGFCGYLRSRYIGQEEEMKKVADDKDHAIGVLEKKSEMLREVNEALEERVLTEANSFAALYDISEKLSHGTLEQILESVPSLVADHMHAERCSVYRFKDDALQLQASHGSEGYALRETIPFDNSLLGLACKQKELLSMHDYMDRPEELESLGESVLAAPLLDDDGELLGAINIDEMPFLRINHSSMTTMGILAKWVGRTLAQAIHFERVRSHAIDDELLEIYTRRYLEQRLAEEFTRSKTYFLPLSLALLKLPREDAQTAQGRIDELKLVTAYLRRSCREIDIICNFSEDMPIAVLMTTTSDEEAEERRAQIQEDLNMLLPQNGSVSRLSIGVASFAAETESWEDLLVAAEKNVG